MHENPSDDIDIKGAVFAVQVELEKRKFLKQPIARFNPKTKEVYMEYADGHTEFFCYAMQQGRYSEQPD